MSVRRKTRLLTLLIALLLLAAALSSLLDYAVQNERAVRKTTYETLSDSANQHRLLFSTKLEDLFSQLRVFSDYVAEENAVINDEMLSAMNRVTEECGLFGVGIVDARTGIANLGSGQTFDASDRAYFSRALSGEQVIDYVAQGHLTNASVAVLSVPVYIGGKVSAVLFASYSADGFAELLKAMAFDGDSYSYITDSLGNMIVQPNHPAALISEGNVLDFFHNTQLEDGMTEADIAARLNGESGSVFSFSYAGQRRYVSFAPLGVNDWVLFYVALDTVVAERTAASSYMVYNLSVKLLLIFAVVGITYWLADRKSRRALALQEEEYRVAANHSEKIIMRYDISKKAATYAPGHAPDSRVRDILTEGVPESVVEAGLVAEESVDDYLSFYGDMRRGVREGSRVFRMRINSDHFAWYQADYTLIGFDKTPRFAIISLYDVTKQREHSLIYEKWQQSLRDRKPNSYSLYHCSVSKNTVLDDGEGRLIPLDHNHNAVNRMEDQIARYAKTRVYKEDRERFLSVLDREVLLLRASQGRRTEAIDYREKLPDGGLRWLRLTIDLMDSPDSAGVEAYLLFENIDEAKRAELEIIERAENDPLTGLLNRATFLKRVDEIIGESGSESVHALLMLDIDSFKLVNDVFGHGAGDQTLVDVGTLLRGGSRRGDLVSRIGGDEFMIFLSDIPGEQAAARKARQVCSLMRKTLSDDVRISASVGIALYPRDGTTFDALYKKADDTLYHVKHNGKNDYAFYSAGMVSAEAEPAKPEQSPATPGEKKRRMLIVDDSRGDVEMLTNLFAGEFRIEKAMDGASAVAKLSHYGSAISIMLLDLMMPGMDGFSVLEKAQQGAETRNIPVVVVSGAEDHEMSLRAIRAGASDYVTKPIDPDILHIRVLSAVSKAENERLRAQNSYLELRSGEMDSYRTVLDRTDTLVITHDWVKGAFLYSPAVSERLSGRYDSRTLWHILLADMVTDSQTVQRMQGLEHDLANDRTRTEASLKVQLKTNSGDKHQFMMTIYKQANDFGLTDKLIISLRDLDTRQARMRGREG